MKRREFITLLGGAASWPLAARAQQPALPVIGFLDSRPPEAMTSRLGAFRQSLKEAGFAEGENVSVVYRWAANSIDRLPEMAAELVRRQAAVIVTTGGGPRPPSRPRRQPRRYPSYSWSAKTRSGWVWSAASRGRAAISQVSIC